LVLHVHERTILSAGVYGGLPGKSVGRESLLDCRAVSDCCHDSSSRWSRTWIQRSQALLLRYFWVLFCVSSAVSQSTLWAQSGQSWIRKVYPDYDPMTGKIPSEGSKVVNVLSALQTDTNETAVLVVRVAIGEKGPLDCEACPRLIDFALLGSDANPLSFQKGILRMDGSSRVSMVPDDFFRGPHQQILGVRIQRAQEGIDAETLYLIDVRPPPRPVLQVQTHFSTCGAPGAGSTAGASRTSVPFNANSPYPITLQTIRQDCQGHLVDQSTVPLTWDSRVRQFVPAKGRP
jgi:hypothetical protein